MRVIISLLIISIPLGSYSQTLNVHKNDGMIHQFNIAEIDSITFTPEIRNYILNEDFESYSVGEFPASGGWELVYNGYGTQYQYVSDSSSISGTRSLQLEGASNWSANAVKQLSVTPEIIYLEVHVKTKKLASSVMNYDEASIGLYNKNIGNWGTIYVRVTFWSDNKIKFGKGGGIFLTLQEWEPNRWYKIKVKYNNIDKKGDVWIDDVIKASGVDLSGPSGSYNSIVLISGNDTHTRSWFDDVKVWSIQ